MKIKNLKLKIWLYLFAAIAVLVFPHKASAGELSLGINPPIIQIEANPGASITTSPITIQNLGEEAITLNIVAKPFTQGDNRDGTVSFTDEIKGPDKQIFDKMQVMHNDHVVDSLTLSPQQETSVILHIGLPKDEPAADYYFSLIFVSNNNTADLKTGNSLSGGIATNILLSIGPKGQTLGSIEQFSVPLFVQKGPVPFTILVKNESNHVIAPTGGIVITNMFGQRIGNVELLPVNILAGAIRAFPDSDQSPEKIENLKLKIENSEIPRAFWREVFLLGPYSATLNLALSDQGPVYTRTIHFFALPAEAIVALSVAIIVVIFIRRRVKQRLS